MGNLVTARVTIRGTRPLLQHEFGEDAIPLEAVERHGVAGNDPTEWKRTCMVDENGRLYVKDTNLFTCLRDGAKNIKKGRSSIQAALVSTLLVMDQVVHLNRSLPKDGDPPKKAYSAPVYIDVDGVRNPATAGRNVRYRLAASPGWECTFMIQWDKTIVSREQMQLVLRDAGTLQGLGNGRKIGKGRFVVTNYEELPDAEIASAA